MVLVQALSSNVIFGLSPNLLYNVVIVKIIPDEQILTYPLESSISYVWFQEIPIQYPILMRLRPPLIFPHDDIYCREYGF